jgi:alkylhydroperoxidase/carboxymuconolactone decarboxylase family protein YurZ
MPAQSSETPVLDLIAAMNASSVEACGLDGRSLMLVRLAALVAVDAPPASYVVNLGVAAGAGVDEQSVRDVLAAVAPIVGTPRTVSALGKMVRGLGLALELAEGDDAAAGSAAS